MSQSLEQIASKRKIKVHDPFAEFLLAEPSLHSFEISLLDCYRFAGHACHAITGAFLTTEAAIRFLFPETNICERGDLLIEFGSQLHERATGPRSNVISYITGSWGDSGFPGLKDKFKRKDLLSYGRSSLGERAIRFKRVSTGQAMIIEYDPTHYLSILRNTQQFPEKWRTEIIAILGNQNRVLKVMNDSGEMLTSPFR